MAELRQVEVLTGYGKSFAEVVKTFVVTEKPHFRRRVEHDGLRAQRVKRLEKLELELGDTQLRGAVSDLTPGKLFWAAADRGKFLKRRPIAMPANTPYLVPQVYPPSEAPMPQYQATTAASADVPGGGSACD